MNFALSLLGHGKGTQQTKFTEVPSIFSQRSVWMPCRRKMQTFWSWLTEKRMLCQSNLMNQRISQLCCHDVWLKPAPTKQSMHYSAMPLAHPPLATTRHTSHRPTLKKAFQPTNAKSVPTNWALWCWAPWLIHLLGPTRNIFSAHWKAPTFDTFFLHPFGGVKMGKSPWKSPGFFLSAKPSFDRWPVLAKGDLCWYLTGFCTHSHLVLSIHLSFKMPYISAIHS